MKLGYIGLGKMGKNMVLNLRDHGHDVVAYNKSTGAYAEVEAAGAQTAPTIAEMVGALGDDQRTVWLMVPWQAVDDVLPELEKHLGEEDVVIDGGNSPFGDSVRRAEQLRGRGIHFLDAGVSGGPGGARHGACMMVGGNEAAYQAHEALFQSLCVENGYGHVGPAGAGHFVKMIHNAIEYGMMQAIAEGFDMLKNNQQFPLDVRKIVGIYAHGSVIESRLIAWLEEGFERYGENLDEISGSASASGEADWAVAFAQQAGIAHEVIHASLAARQKSQDNPSYQGQLISVMRNMFGGHQVKKDAS